MYSIKVGRLICQLKKNMSRKHVYLILLMGTILSGCVSQERLQQISSFDLCYGLVKYPSYNIHQGTRRKELERRGEDCSQYQEQIANKLAEENEQKREAQQKIAMGGWSHDTLTGEDAQSRLITDNAECTAYARNLVPIPLPPSSTIPTPPQPENLTIYTPNGPVFGQIQKQAPTQPANAYADLLRYQEIAKANNQQGQVFGACMQQRGWTHND